MNYIIIITMSLFLGATTAQALKVTKVEISQKEHQVEAKKESSTNETLFFAPLMAAVGIYKNTILPALENTADVLGELGFEACKAAGCYKNKAAEKGEWARVQAGVAAAKAGLSLSKDRIMDDYNKNFGGK